MPKKIKILLFTTALLAAGLACNLSSGGSGEAPTPIEEFSNTEAENSQNPNLLFFDDFSDTRNNWTYTFRDETGMVDFDQEGFRIQVNQSFQDYWAIPGLNVEDVIIEVDARQIGGPSDSDFGLICRHQDDERFYFFFASLEGFYAILKILPDGNVEPLGSDDYLETNAILSGDAVNHLRADCIGDTLTFYINGRQVHQATDSEYGSGDVGVIAGTFEVAGTDMLFDNFSVRAP